MMTNKFELSVTQAKLKYLGKYGYIKVQYKGGDSLDIIVRVFSVYISMTRIMLRVKPVHGGGQVTIKQVEFDNIKRDGQEYQRPC